MPHFRRALIVGAGDGLSASLARLLTVEAGMRVGLAARNTEKLTALAAETHAATFACDASKADEVEALFAHMDDALGGAPDVVIYNASGRAAGAIPRSQVSRCREGDRRLGLWRFLVAHAAATRMLPKGEGAILFTGASASVKGYAQSAPFAMGKFALRGLAQSMARELSPQGIHVAHFVIDGGIRSDRRPEPADKPDSTLDPDAIARTYLDIMKQDRSAWTWEVELRPWVERF